MNIFAVRGAVTLEDGDERRLMPGDAGRLISALAEANGFKPDDIVSIQLTQTTDLTRKNAAAALREARPDYSLVPLFCAQEPDVQGSLPRTVRILVTFRGNGPGRPVYLGKAATLRPDLTGG